jgi:hypothetical protein
VNNTMYLHSFNVKNALVSTKSRPKDRPDTWDLLYCEK